MSHKIIKSALPALALGATVGVAQADVLDDAINEAKVAGFSTDVQTRTEKVSSQSEADRLNQEEASRVQALAKRIQNQVASVKLSDQSLKQVVTAVLTDQTKVSTESSGQNQTITKENSDNQKAYEDAVKAVEAKNAQAQATYEAEKTRIAQENAKAVADYEAEKAQVLAQNAESKKTYEDALKRIASENQQAKEAYDATKQKAESELHTKEWNDTKLIEDAKSAGVTIRPVKVVDKGTVKESDLTALGSEYDKASAEVRAKLEAAKKELAKANVEFKASNELKQFVTDQRAAIKAIIDEDNAKADTTHIRTVIKNGPVIENSDTLKQEYVKLLETAQDDRARIYREAFEYYTSKGLSGKEAYERARQSAAVYFMPISRTIEDYKKSVLATSATKVVEVPIDGKLPILPIGTNVRDESNPDAVAFRKAVDAIESEVYKIWKSNEVVETLQTANSSVGTGPGATLSDNYDEDLKKYEAGQESLEKLRSHFRRGLHDTDLVMMNNDNIRSEAGAYAVSAASRVGRGGNQNAYINENNMEIVKSSDSVQFLKSDTDSGAMFDVCHDVETSKTPVYFPLAEAQNPSVMTETTLVRIPKGQSITVKYTLKNGQAYLKGKQSKDNTVAQFFAEETAAQYKKESKKLTDEDIQDVYTIEATITNNGAVHDGDIIVGVRNDTVSPFYVGVSNGSRPSDRIQWKLPQDEPSMAFNYRLDTSFRNQKGQLLTVGVPQGEWEEKPNMYHGEQMGHTMRLKSSAYYVTGNFVPLDQAEELEMVDKTDIQIQLDSDTPASNLKWKGYAFVNNPVTGYPISLPVGWKDKYMWKTLKTGMSDATTFSTTHKTYNKVLLDWGARDDMNNWSTLHETGALVYHLSQSVSGLVDFDFTVVPRPIKPPTELKMPKLNLEFVREITLPQPKPSAPVDPATVASIEPVKWVAKYTKPYTEKPPVPKENPVEPPILPEPKKPEEKPLPTPPKKEELPKRPDLKAIASESNSFVVRSRKAVRPTIAVERVQYVAEGRVSSANSLVVRTRNDVKRAGSGNSFIIRRM